MVSRLDVLRTVGQCLLVSSLMVERRLCSIPTFRRVHAPHLQPESDVVRYGLVGKQGEVLEHYRHLLPADLPQLVSGTGRDIDAVDQNYADSLTGLFEESDLFPRPL